MSLLRSSEHFSPHLPGYKWLKSWGQVVVKKSFSSEVLRKTKQCHWWEFQKWFLRRCQTDKFNGNYNHCRTLIIWSQNLKCGGLSKYHTYLRDAWIVLCFCFINPPWFATGTIAGLWFDAVVPCRLLHWLPAFFCALSYCYMLAEVLSLMRRGTSSCNHYNQ